MKEAYLYEKLEHQQVRCQLCAHRCLISEGKRGICSVRENQKGILYSLVYGKAIAANIDPIEKKPLFHFQPGSKSFSLATAGCNFRCEFCQNWQISQVTKGSQKAIIGEELLPEKAVKQAKDQKCASIAYTYTEPTIFFEYAYDTAQLAQKYGLKNVFVTNGYQTPETIEKMVGVIDAANVDLKSFSDEYYRRVCGARLEPVLASIKFMWERGIWVEVTTLVVPKLNDSNKELSEIAKFLVSVSQNLPWHISRFHPDYKMTDSYPTPLETLEKAYDIGKKAGLNYVYLGNVPGTEKESTFCPFCDELLVKREIYQVELKIKEKNCPKCGAEVPVIL